MLRDAQIIVWDGLEAWSYSEYRTPNISRHCCRRSIGSRLHRPITSIEERRWQESNIDKNSQVLYAGSPQRPTPTCNMCHAIIPIYTSIVAVLTTERDGRFQTRNLLIVLGVDIRQNVIRALSRVSKCIETDTA